MFPLVQQGKIFGVLQLVNASHVFALTLKGVNNHARAMHLKKLDLIAFAIMAAIQSTDLFHLRREYGFSNGTLVEAEFWCGLLDIVE